jgi:hypothetical protein
MRELEAEERLVLEKHAVTFEPSPLLKALEAFHVHLSRAGRQYGERTQDNSPGASGDPFSLESGHGWSPSLQPGWVFHAVEGVLLP